MKKLILLFFVICFSSYLFAQNTILTTAGDTIDARVDYCMYGNVYYKNIQTGIDDKLNFDHILMISGELKERFKRLISTKNPAVIFEGNNDSFQYSSVSKNVFDTEIDYMRFCLNKYYEVRKVGYIFTGISLATTGLNAAFVHNTEQKYLYAAAGGIALVGIFEFFNAEKWLNRSAIKPSSNGIGFVVEF